MPVSSATAALRFPSLRAPRHYTVATLGKLPGLDEQVQASWDSIDDLLEGRAPGRQLDLGGKPPAPAVHSELLLRAVAQGFGSLVTPTSCLGKGIGKRLSNS